MCVCVCVCVQDTCLSVIYKVMTVEEVIKKTSEFGNEFCVVSQYSNMQCVYPNVAMQAECSASTRFPDLIFFNQFVTYCW